MGMTKEEFLKRCETIYDKGLMKDREFTSLLRSAVDVYIRLRYCYAQNRLWFNEIKKHHQGQIAIDELTMWESYDKTKLLASDPAYQSLVMACILDHPCAICGTDKRAWHTRYGFCDHKKENADG